MPLSDGKIKHLNALSNKDGVIAAAAMDQRGSLRKMIAQAKNVPQDQVPDEQLVEFKTAVSKVLTPHASAILLDTEFGLPAAKAPRTKGADRAVPASAAALSSERRVKCPFSIMTSR